MSNTTGPKIAVVDSIPDGAVYGDDGRAFLRMFQALIQPNVINMTTSAAPVSPVNGDMYVVASVGSGAWVGKTNYVAYWTTDNPDAPSGEWNFYQPIKGWIVVNQANTTQYMYNGSTWAAVGGGGGTGFSTTTTTITAAQVKALGTTPIQVTAAGGSNVLNVPFMIVWQVKQGGTPFDQGGTYAFGDITGLNPTFASWGSSGVINVAGGIYMAPPVSFSSGTVTPVQLVNQPYYFLNIDGHASDPTVGDGSITVTVYYTPQTTV